MFVFLLLLHYIGLTLVIALSVLLGMYELAAVNGVVFLALAACEVLLCIKQPREAPARVDSFHPLEAVPLGALSLDVAKAGR